MGRTRGDRAVARGQELDGDDRTDAVVDGAAVLAPARRHVAIVHRHYLDMMLMGLKRSEARLARTRSMPFGVIAAGDVVHLKQASGPFRAVGVVREVLSFDGLDAAGVDRLRERFAAELCADDAFWEQKAGARYATVIRFASIEAASGVPAGFVRTPGSRAAWYVLPGVG